MIGASQLALVARARAWLEYEEERGKRSQLHKIMAPVLPPPGKDGDLSPRAFRSLMDAFAAEGFCDAGWPVLAKRRRDRLEMARHEAGVGDIAWTTRLRTLAADMRRLDGFGFLELLGLVETHDAAVAAAVVADLREVTPPQVRLCHVASNIVGADKHTSALTLQRLGGVNSTKDLDRHGFNLVMRYHELWGFGRAAGPVVTAAPEAPRIGFASQAQLDLICALWAEWSGNGDGAALGAWLERFHHVSALRFLTAPAAAKVITSLKAMKARRRQPETA